MATFCGAPDPELGMVRGLLDSVDCNVVSLTETGYAALSQPGSPMAAVLTLMLTLYIAFIGYRLMIGRTPLRVGDATVSALKIGAVLALATSWPTYQQLVFDVLFRGPEQLASQMMSAFQVQGDGDVFDGLQATYDALQRAAGGLSQRGLAATSPLQGGPGWGALELNIAGLIMLLTTLGVVLASKIVLGLLLGLGPLFVTLLLFDSTRGLFEGWLRAALVFALAPMMAIIGLALQLMLLAPHLQALEEARDLPATDLEPANAIFLLTLICSAVAGALLAAVGVIAISLRLPGMTPRTAGSAQGAGALGGGLAVVPAAVAVAGAPRELQAQPRVLAVAAAAMALERRDARDAQALPDLRRTGPTTARATPSGSAAAATPLGQSYRRAARPRAAASNMRRDR